MRDLGILEAYSFKPLMDGKALAKALKTAPGPWMKDALDVVMAYQLRHPEKANAEDAIAEVQATRQQNGNTNGGELSSSLVRHFLALTIRPLFAKARPTTVTEAGRKNTATVLPKKFTAENMDESVTKPWKNEREAYALDLLIWCIKALNERIVEEVWPRIIPPLLTLVDDWEAKYKTLGVELTQQLFQVTAPSMLARTGLGEVFEEALMPCLTFLPDVTPEQDSIPLLNVAYPTLLNLAALRYPQSPLSSSNANSTAITKDRIKLLDSLIRKGTIYGCTYCSNYPRVTATLFTHLVPILNILGIDSVKHLQYLLPVITETLSHPLADAQIYTLLQTTKALQAIILNGWPRMLGYRGEVLKGLTMAWLTVDGMEGAEGVMLRNEMKETVVMLKCALGDDVDFDEEARLLVEANSKVEDLLIA
jgi:tRNA nucleotidyltransferase (CCA-adding enzyme)